MSYDIHLLDPVTNEPATVPGHLMYGGTYAADYHPATGTFTPALSTEASLNITYNYGHYYYEAFGELGIRSIYHITGLESIEMFDKAISFLIEKYKDKNEWIFSKRKEKLYFDSKGNELDFLNLVERKEEYTEKEVDVEVYEGDTSDYWKDTAANAIRPLYQLRTLAVMRPDCIWDGD